MSDWIDMPKYTGGLLERCRERLRNSEATEDHELAGELDSFLIILRDDPRNPNMENFTRWLRYIFKVNEGR